MMLKGTAVSPGIGTGKAYRFMPETGSRNEGVSAVLTEQDGLAAFRSAVQQAAAEITRLTETLTERVGAAEAGILRAQLFLLADPLWLRETEGLISAGMPPAEAVAAVADKFAGLFMASGDRALEERVADIRDIAVRITGILSDRNDLREKNKENPGNAGEIVLLAEEIYPSLVAALDPVRIRGLAAGSGGYTSHAAIIARALGIPAVMGVPGISGIEPGTVLLVDGNKGEVWVNPEEGSLRHYRQKTPPRQDGKLPGARVFTPVSTRDGVMITVAANSGTLTEAKMARAVCAAGIGLYRTEYAYLERNGWPAEDELYEEYAAVMDLWPDGEVIFRTFDLGGDKVPVYINLPQEENPMLGIRGIRLARQFPECCMAQFKALLRAAACGRAKIMVPLVTSLDEFRWACALLREAQKLTGCRESPAIGLMVEVPATALMLDRYAKEADFFSLGTNDLVQYTLAVDRLRSAEQPYFHPGFLRIMQTAVTAAGRAGKPVSICGEMAGDLKAVPLLLGMGIRYFSAGVDRLEELREFIGSLAFAKCQKVARKAEQLATTEEVSELVGGMFTGQAGFAPESVKTPVRS